MAARVVGHLHPEQPRLGSHRHDGVGGLEPQVLELAFHHFARQVFALSRVQAGDGRPRPFRHGRLDRMGHPEPAAVDDHPDQQQEEHRPDDGELDRRHAPPIPHFDTPIVSHHRTS
ncbi:hypothetical protein D9M69_676650 [compost metagenome]